MNLNRQEISTEQIEMQKHSEWLCNAPETIQEDQAFMNRMKTVSFRNFRDSDLKRLWRIALRGNEARRIQNERN